MQQMALVNLQKPYIFSVVIKEQTEKKKKEQQWQSKDDFMQLGMEIAGYEHWRYTPEATNLANFKDAYGPTLLTCKEMWADMNRLNLLTTYLKPIHLLLGYNIFSDMILREAWASSLRFSQHTLCKKNARHTQKRL